MSSQTPALYVLSIWDLCDIKEPHRHRGVPGTEGSYSFYVHGDGSAKEAGILFICPGCRDVVACDFSQHCGKADEPVWKWDGDRSAPSLTPSIVHQRDGRGCGWHGFLTKGVFVA